MTGGGGNVLAAQINPGGNPDKYRKVTDIVDKTTAARSTILGFHEFKSSVFDPSTSGEILSLDFSIDFMNIDVFGTGQSHGIALKQNDHIFIAGFAPTTLAGEMLNTWQSRSVLGLVASDFQRVDSSIDTLVDPSLHPDFSSSGSQLVFGFHTRNSIPPGSPIDTQATLIVGYDNWEVAVNAIPEPSTIAIWSLLGGIGLVVGHRRSKREAA